MKVIFLISIMYPQFVFAQKFLSGISGLRFYNYPNSNIKVHFPQSVLQSESNDRFCKMLPSKKLKLNILDESKQSASASLIFKCGSEFGRLDVEESIDFKTKVSFKGRIIVSKEGRDKYILSSDKFRIQFFYYPEKKSENCSMIIYDILNNNFYESEKCAFN